MAPYNFEAADTDAILRPLDGKELRVHKVILSLASPVFQGMLNLPQPAGFSPKIPKIDIPESSDILQPLIQYLYPCSPPEISDISMWAALYTIADKYSVESVTDLLRGMLIPRFLKASPLRVYALASCWGFEEEAKAASRGTLTMDISKGFPEEDATLMGTIACQKLYLLHIQRRDKARPLLNNCPYRSSERGCSCPPMNFQALARTLSRRVSTRPWLTAEELCEEAAAAPVESQMCGDRCPNSFKNIYAWFSLILKEMSELPQTI